MNAYISEFFTCLAVDLWILSYMETCISWWYNTRISFIIHKLIDACYDLFAYLLEDEQRYNLGELIRAFCIIIVGSYRSILHCYLHWSFIIYAVLDDLWDFPTKSFLLVFNFLEAEKLLFPILIFHGPYRTKKSCSGTHNCYPLWGISRCSV
jgi:hypothetical protein